MENKTCENCNNLMEENHQCVSVETANEMEHETPVAVEKSEEVTEEVIEPIEEKVTFKHPSLNNKASNSRYVMTYEDFKKSRVKTESGIDKVYTDAKTENVKTDKAGESKDPASGDQK